MDAVIGLDPFLINGTIYVDGELRLFIVSIGAHAELTVKVAEKTAGNLSLYVHGQACGHVSFLFFDVEGCVDITISGPKGSRADAGTGRQSVLAGTLARAARRHRRRSRDRCQPRRCARAGGPARDQRSGLPCVPIDSIPIIGMSIAPCVAPNFDFAGLGTEVPIAPGLLPDGYAERGGEQYRYDITGLTLERIDPNSGAVVTPTIQGSAAPMVWWSVNDATTPSILAQLALLTWNPSPATKAIEYSEQLKQTRRRALGTICEDAAPPADVLWTFRMQALGRLFEGLGPAGLGMAGSPGHSPHDGAYHEASRLRAVALR